jgi:hypothetical protein
MKENKDIREGNGDYAFQTRRHSSMKNKWPDNNLSSSLFQPENSSVRIISTSGVNYDQNYISRINISKDGQPHISISGSWFQNNESTITPP